MISSILKKIVCEKGEYLFYRYSSELQGDGHLCEAVNLYSRSEEIPSSFLSILFPKGTFMNPMWHRLKCGHAKLLCYTDDNCHLLAYGWVQDWSPFQRKFAMITRDGVMLGPYWTSPKYRGKNIYGKLLQASLSICSKDKPILIYTAPDNIASQHGIMKAKFQFVGGYRIKLWFRLFVSWTRLPVKSLLNHK